MRAAERRRRASQSPTGHSPRGGAKDYGGTPAQDGESPVGWFMMSFITLASLLGAGLLTLPWAYQQLGWIPAELVLYGVSVIATYSGALYARVLSSVPWVSNWHELGRHAFGRWGVLVSGLAYAALFSVPPVLHLTAAKALQQVFPTSEQPSLFITSFIVTAVVLPLSQLRHLSKLGWLTVVGSVAMTVAVTVLAVKLGLVGNIPVGQGHETHWVANKPLMPSLVAVLDIIFVFSGQENWLRFVSAMGPSMRRKRQFTFSTLLAYTVLTYLAGGVGTVGYWRFGGTLDIQVPIISQLSPGPLTTWINAGILLSVIISYVVHINVVTQMVLEMCAPELFKSAHTAHGHQLRGSSPDPTHPTLPHHHKRGRPLSGGTHAELAHPLLPSAPPSAPETPRGPYTPALSSTRGSAERVQVVTLLSEAHEEPHTFPAMQPTTEGVTSGLYELGVGGSGARAPHMETAAEEAVQVTLPMSEPGEAPAATSPRSTTSRTVSEAERALGTGVVFPCLVEAVQPGSEPLAEEEGVEAHDPEFGYVPPFAPPLSPPTPPPVGAGARGPPPTTTHHDPTLYTDYTSTGAAPVASKVVYTRAALTPPPAGPTSAGGVSGGAPPQHVGVGVAAGSGDSSPAASHHLRMSEYLHNLASKRVLWGLVSSIFVLLSWCVCNVWPHINSLVALIGAVGGVSCMMLIPCLLALIMLRLSSTEALVCRVLCVVSVALSVFGGAAAIDELRNGQM